MVIFLKVMVLVSVLILIVGLIKPNWVLFFMKRPDRITVLTVSLLLFMASWTGIAKLTLKPKERVPQVSEESRDASNELQLTR